MASLEETLIAIQIARKMPSIIERVNVKKTRCQARQALRDLDERGQLECPREGEEIRITYAGTILRIIGEKGQKIVATLLGLE